MANVKGSSADILFRVKGLIPKGWFSWTAPYRDAVMGGLSDSASWCYGLISYARSQLRLATAYGIWLDIVAMDFLGTFLPRKGYQDDAYRVILKATILQERVTRQGMINAITALTGITPNVFEPWNTYDTGAYSPPAGTGGTLYGSMGYGVGRGGYGNMALKSQVFIQVHRIYPAGIPNVAGYGISIGGYGVGSLEYTGVNLTQIGVTNQMILDLINKTKPVGCRVWVAFD